MKQKIQDILGKCYYMGGVTIILDGKLLERRVPLLSNCIIPKIPPSLPAHLKIF